MNKRFDIPRTPLANDGTENRNPSDLGFWQLIREDFQTHHKDWGSQGFWAIFWHRFGNWRMGIRPKLLRAPCTLLYRVMYKACQILGGIDLPYTVLVGRRVRLDHFGSMILVPIQIGDEVVLRHNTTMGIATVAELLAKPVIGDRVDVGVGAVIIGAVHVGDDAIVGANAVVTKDVPAGAVVGGIPARILRYRDEHGQT